MIFATRLQNIYMPEMIAANEVIVGVDTIKNRLCISSDPDVHAKFAQRFIDEGFDQLYFHSADPNKINSSKATGEMCFRSSGKGTVLGMQLLYKN